jgi:hypothetical protein
MSELERKKGITSENDFNSEINFCPNFGQIILAEITGETSLRECAIRHHKKAAGTEAPEAEAVYGALGIPFVSLVLGLNQYFSKQH